MSPNASPNGRAPATKWWSCPSAMSGETNRLAWPGQGVGSRRKSSDQPIAASWTCWPPLANRPLQCPAWPLRLQAEGMAVCQLCGLASARFAPTTWPTPRRASRAIDDTRVRADLDGRQSGHRHWFSGRGRRRQHHHTRAGAAPDTSAVAIAAAMKAQRMPDLHRRRRRLHHRPAHRARSAPPGTPSASKRCWRWRALGSKVLQIRSVEFAGKYKVPLRVLSSFTPDGTSTSDEEATSGTLITFEEDENMEQAIVSGIAFNRDEAKISVLGVPDKSLASPTVILGPVADANIDRGHDHPERSARTARPTSASPCIAGERLRQGHGLLKGTKVHADAGRQRQSWATPRSAKSASSASACAATSALPAKCSVC